MVHILKQQPIPWVVASFSLRSTFRPRDVPRAAVPQKLRCWQPFSCWCRILHCGGTQQHQAPTMRDLDDLALSWWVGSWIRMYYVFVVWYTSGWWLKMTKKKVRWCSNGTLHPGLTQMFPNTRLISFRFLQFRHGGLWHSERLVAEGGSVLSALISAESQVRSGSSWSCFRLVCAFDFIQYFCIINCDAFHTHT